MNSSDFEIIDLNDQNRDMFCICLEDWSEEMKEAGDHKQQWCRYMAGKDWGAKLARDSSGKLVGMVQYVPVEYTAMEGKNLYFIQCVWIPRRKGEKGARKHGLGKRLLAAAEEDVKSRGGLGMAAWGVTIPVWMKSSWYKKQGYLSVEKQGIMELVWKPFSTEAEAPRMGKPRKNPPSLKGEGALMVSSFVNGICPAMNIGAERARKAAAALGDKVQFQIISTREPEALKEWGISDALYFNGKEIPLGPPPSQKKLEKLMHKELKAAMRYARG